ncbi:MAG: hypothetical protein A2W25_05125 [candidate division Zixibacteria bacterium RBG_16_53_22]|nr:MAG: hypothetical protein A2W25_05125 [candidate division Zixibacteria bacterium RBG_16_53_22]
MTIIERLFPPAYPTLKKVIVNLRSGTSFRAVVWKCAGEFVVLRNAEMLQNLGHAERHIVDGEVIVRLAEVDFMQVVS